MKKRRKNPVENRTHAMKAITVKKGTGAYVTARDSDNNSARVAYDFAFDGYENAVHAAEALQKKMNWSGTLVGGHAKDAYVFTFRTAVTRHSVGPKKNPLHTRWKTGDRFQLTMDITTVSGKKHKKGDRGFLTLAGDHGDGAYASFDKTPNHYPEHVPYAWIVEVTKNNPRKRRKNPEYIDMDSLPDRSGRTVPVDEKTGKILRVGDKRKSGRGEVMTIEAFHPPRHDASSGHVTTDKGHYYIGVIGGEFVKPVRAVKNPRKRNPDAFVIVIRVHGKRHTYDANAGRFSDGKKPSLYATAIGAKNRAEFLLKKHPNLRAHKVTIEHATAQESGAVFGARPRKDNPRPKK